MANTISTTVISAIYAETPRTGRIYAINNFRVTLQMGATASCSFAVICEIPKSRVASIRESSELGRVVRESVRRTSSIASLMQAFAYRTPVKIWQVMKGKRQLVFNGFVFNTGDSVNFAGAAFSARITVTAANASILYNNEANPRPTFITNKGTEEAVSIGQMRLQGHEARAEFIQEAQKSGKLGELVKLIAMVIDGITKSQKGVWTNPTSNSLKETVSLQSFVNIEGAPTLGFIQKVANVYQFATIISGEIESGLMKSSGISVMSSMLSAFFMSFVPRIRNSNKCVDIIVDIGTRKYRNPEKQPVIRPSEIISFVGYPAQRRLGEYTTFATTPTVGGAIKIKSIFYALTLGYDEDGRPKKTERTYQQIREDITEQKTSKHIMPFGAITFIPMPSWAGYGYAVSEKKDKNGQATPREDSEKRWTPVAKTLTTMLALSSGAFSSKLRLTILPEKYEAVKNRIGDVFKIDRSNTASGSRLISYGRLSDIDYTMEVSTSGIQLGLVLTFDNVLTEEEYKVFAISLEDIGIIEPNGK